MSSTASDNTKKTSLHFRLDKVNTALEVLNIPPIPYYKAQDIKTINLKIESIGVEIRKKLGIERSIKTTDEKVLEQFVNEYNDL